MPLHAGGVGNADERARAARAHLPHRSAVQHRRSGRPGEGEDREFVARIAQLALGAQDEHRQALQRRREDLARAREQKLVGRWPPDDEARLQATLGRAEAGEAGGGVDETRDVVGELALQERRGVGAAGANHATIGEAAKRPDREHVGHGPLSWCCPGFEGARVL
jgi:hypothetical protein